MDAESKRLWREHWLSSIRELSDIHTQRLTWLNHLNANPHYSYVEYRSCYEDDLFIDERGGYRGLAEQNLLTPDEAGAVLRLHAMLTSYIPPGDDNYDHVAILRDPAWISITTEAEAARVRLLEVVTDPLERGFLTEYSVHALDASTTQGSS